MYDDVSPADLLNIQAAERYFDLWARDEAWFFTFMVQHPATLFLAGSFVYTTLVRAMYMKPIRDRTPEELEDLQTESAPWVKGCSDHTTKLIQQLIAVLIHIGELRASK